MTRKLTIFFVAAALGVLQAAAAETYRIDKNHSEVGFQIRHLLTKVRGAFADVEGAITLDREAAENSSVSITIQAASIDTNNSRRDNHLRSADFFDVEKYPLITFESSKVVKTGDDSYDVTGKLTIRDTSKEVTLPVSFLGSMKDNRGVLRAGFETEITINRQDFGLVYNRALEAGGLLLGDDVKITINLETIDASAAPPRPAGAAAGRGGQGGPGGRGPGGAGGFLARIMSNDADGDGRVSKEEAPERLQQRFDDIDANGDGYLEESELQQMMQGFGNRQGRGPGSPGGRRQ